VSALLVHVFDESVLIGLVGRARRSEGEERKGMFHMMVGLRKEVDIELA